MVLLLTGFALPDSPLYGSMTAHASTSGDARGDYYKQSSFPIGYLEQEEIHTITKEGNLGPVNAVTWYQSTPTETATYVFFGSRKDYTHLDTYGSIYTKNTELGYYEQLIQDDESGNYGQFKIKTTLTAGTTYYLYAGYSNSFHVEEYVLEADILCENGITPTFEWYTIDKDTGNKKILSGTGSAYTYTESGSASNETRIYCTVSAGIDSETSTFFMSYIPISIVRTSINGTNTDGSEFQMNLPYALQVEAYSTTGSPLTYTWKIGDKILQTGDSDSLSFTPTQESLEDGSLSFELICEASDEEGCTETSLFYFRYAPISVILEIGVKQTYGNADVFRGGPYTLKINATTDPEKTLTYQRQKMEGSVIGSESTYQYTMESGTTSETILCTVSNGSESDTHRFRLSYPPLAGADLTVNGSRASGNAIPVHAGEFYRLKVSANAAPDA